MAITFRQAKELLAEYADRAGLCADDPRVDLFVIKVLQYILFKGPNDALRAFAFQARQGCITIPYELEVPLKVSIDDRSGDVWSSWFKYYDNSNFDSDCIPAANALIEEPGRFPTAYELPRPSQIGVLGICDEAEDAHIIVKGFDKSGREIFTVHKGDQIAGEYLSIVKNQVRVSSVEFAKITNVVKTKTNGYVQLLGANIKNNWRCFLADYSPLEEIPQYRKFKLTIRCRENAIVNVLGRIRLKENYADTDIIPIENLHILTTAAQGLQLQKNNNFEGAAAKDKAVDIALKAENQYKNVSTAQPLDVYQPTSGGAIKNVIGKKGLSNLFNRRWR